MEMRLCILIVTPTTLVVNCCRAKMNKWTTWINPKTRLMYSIRCNNLTHIYRFMTSGHLSSHVNEEHPRTSRLVKIRNVRSQDGGCRSWRHDGDCRNKAQYIIDNLINICFYLIVLSFVLYWVYSK